MCFLLPQRRHANHLTKRCFLPSAPEHLELLGPNSCISTHTSTSPWKRALFTIAVHSPSAFSSAGHVAWLTPLRAPTGYLGEPQQFVHPGQTSPDSYQPITKQDGRSRKAHTSRLVFKVRTLLLIQAVLMVALSRSFDVHRILCCCAGNNLFSLSGCHIRPRCHGHLSPLESAIRDNKESPCSSMRLPSPRECFNTHHLQDVLDWLKRNTILEFSVVMILLQTDPW